MAVIQARKNKKGTTYQVLIRARDGHPPKYKNFPTKEEAKHWAKLEEARRLQETYFPDEAKKKHTLPELIDRYIEEVLPSKPKNAKDTKRHLIWWKGKIGKYGLNLISYDLIDKYRKELINSPTERGGKRNPATVNRYMASLSVVFTGVGRNPIGVKKNMVNINPMGVFDFQLLQKFEKIAPPLKLFSARDGAKISYRFYDSLNKDRVVIFLHGSSAHGEYLHGFADYLSSQRSVGQVYVPNLRGHYKSGTSRGDCSYIGQLEDDLYDLIQHFKLQNKSIYLVGHSSGGGLAIRFGGGPYQNLIQGYVLLSPAIPTAPTMRQGTAGGWAIVSIAKIIALSILNSMDIKKLNHAHVIQFNKPKQYCDGKETLSYSFNLNSSYHPRQPYQNDIKALKDKYIVFIGSQDEANDPLQFPNVMESNSSEFIQIIDGVKHLDIVCNQEIMEKTATWIETKAF